jgi:hypothetical protein
MMAAPQIVPVEKTHSQTSLTTKLYRRPLAVGNARLEANTGIISMHRHRKDVAMAPNAEKLELAFISSR